MDERKRGFVEFMKEGALALAGCSLACVVLYLGTDSRLLERLGIGPALPEPSPGTQALGGGTAPFSPGSLGMSCLVDHQGAPCPWSQPPDAGHRATNFLFYAAPSTPPAYTRPPPHFCVALADAGQACLDADTKDQAYRQLFDAVLASPHGFHRRAP